MVVFPNAKINVGLQIINKRPDNYHNIESVFYPVDWCDVLEIVPANTLSFNSSGIDIPGDKDNNLCLKAFQLLKTDYKISSVAMHLHKVIPIGAGLGGGSADGAFTIKALNELFGLGLTIEKMQDYARKLGSDCAFFIENKPVLAKDKGDIFESCALNLDKYSIALVYPNLHVSTAEAYAGVKPQYPEFSVANILSRPLVEWSGLLKNDFEASLFDKYPQISQLKTALYNQGALYASMTGSGSTCFGIFATNTILNLPEGYTVFYQNAKI